MQPLTLISFIRHGQVHNPQDIFYGRLPGFRLSEEGNLQAQAASRILQNKNLAAVFSSPLLRARQTAAWIHAAQDHVPLHISQLLNEVHTPFDGHPASEVRARDWDMYTGIPSEYEQPADVLERVQKYISRVRSQYLGQHVAAITHGDLIAFSILWVKHAPISPEAKKDLRRLGLPDRYPVPCSITTFTFRTTAADELPGFEYICPLR